MKSELPTSPVASPASPGIPSVDRVLRHANCLSLIENFGRMAVVESIRAVLERRRGSPAGPEAEDQILADILSQVARDLEDRSKPSLKRVINLTGTILHTNLGRAALPQEALDAIQAVAGGASNLEFDLQTGKRGDRDDHVEALLVQLTGAEAATVVNNNAAALLLVLNSLARNKEVPTSRGELIEIGGAFRLPDIMSRSGCRLREVGTTNRTHLRDFAEAIGPKTALVMKVHTSNFSIEGFTAAVPESDLANLCRQHKLPFMVDLGAGTLVDLRAWGLPYEPTPAQSIAHGADLVTFSGDKLLGGPQAGLIVGRADLIDKIKRNPLKRALRVDKMTIAALEAVLRLYSNPDRLAQRLPALRALARPLGEIQMTAERVAGSLQNILGKSADIKVVPCESEIGSGALPTQHIASAAISIIPLIARGRGTAIKKMASAFRALPMPVIGRVHEGALLFDCRCLEDEATFISQLAMLEKSGEGPG